jgi:5,10-methylene-tetrahydrofolate dehydrogenase/methenyl tetrahydrofolate cyclohydrolase
MEFNATGTILKYNFLMNKIIDGKALAKKHEEALKLRLRNLIDSRFRGNDNVRNPSIVSFCNQDDPPSVKYTFMKLQKATDLGIDFSY